jgi:hypothetical protein
MALSCRPIAELLAYAGPATVPRTGDDAKRWVAEDLKPIFQAICDAIQNDRLRSRVKRRRAVDDRLELGSLIYAELVLRRLEDRRLEDNRFFFGVFLREDLEDHYKRIVQGLTRGHLTVGGAPEFENGRLGQEGNNEQWLFAFTNTRQSRKRHHLGYKTIYYGLKESLSDTGLDETEDQWLATARQCDLGAAWRTYTDLVKEHFPSVNCIAGIPLLAPAPDADGEGGKPSELVGSLFIGLEESRESVAHTLVGEIARYTYIFALRTFALQYVGRDARRQKDAEVETRVLESLGTEKKKIESAISRAKNQIADVLRELDLALAIPMGGNIHRWIRCLAPFFTNGGPDQGTKFNCIPVAPQHDPSLWNKDLLAAALLEFADAPRSPKYISLYDYWQQWSMEERKSLYVQVLDRLGFTAEIETNDDGHVSGAFLRHVKGWRYALRESTERDLNLAMLELALGANFILAEDPRLYSAKAEKKVLVSSLEWRERALSGLYSLISDFIRVGKHRDTPLSLSPPVTLAWSNDGQALRVCVSRFSCGCDSELIAAKNVTSLFRSVVTSRRPLDPALGSATQSLMRALGLDPQSQDGGIVKSDVSIRSVNDRGAPLAGASWEDEGLWLVFYNQAP